MITPAAPLWRTLSPVCEAGAYEDDRGNLNGYSGGDVQQVLRIRCWTGATSLATFKTTSVATTTVSSGTQRLGSLIGAPALRYSPNFRQGGFSQVRAH